MDHLTGVFFLLAYGITFAMFYESCRMIYIVRKRARENNVSATSFTKSLKNDRKLFELNGFFFLIQLSFRQEMKGEFKFLLKSLADPDKPKPVRVFRRDSDAS